MLQNQALESLKTDELIDVIVVIVIIVVIIVIVIIDVIVVIVIIVSIVLIPVIVGKYSGKVRWLSSRQILVDSLTKQTATRR